MNKRELLDLSYDEKIKLTKQLILEWFLQYDGKVYVSFSGGKDSTVLLDIVRKIKGCENVKGIFFDTGLEYPEIRDFVKTKDNIVFLKPKKTFKQVVEEYGFPIISKEYSKKIREVRATKSQKLKKLILNGNEKGYFKLPEKWKTLIKSDFKISEKCCYIMKKTPAKKAEKKFGYPMVAIMAEESNQRMVKFLGTNCNAFTEKHPQSNPMMFWREQDVLRYIHENNLPIASIYGKVVCENGLYRTTLLKRTGCMFCAYGLHLEKKPNRFDLMKESHPKQYDYIMNKLGFKKVLKEYLACANGGQYGMFDIKE